MMRYTPTPEDLQREMDDGNIKRRDHPTLPLSLYTYTEKCVYSGSWSPTTRACRGLIFETHTHQVVAWPFEKFFSYHDHANGKPYAPPLPDLPFTVSAKVDCSLWIVFHYRDQWHVATKGSFVSDQAQWAQRWLDRQRTANLSPGITYLAEIVYPENRIVVDYGDLETLVLLGTYDAQGRELPLSGMAGEGRPWEWMGGEVNWPLDVDTLDEVVRAAADSRTLNGSSLPGTEGEGWVVRFSDGTRVKVKTADYVRLHGTLTRTSARTIWEALSRGSDPAAILGTVPDEFLDWVRQTSANLQAQHLLWTKIAEREYDRLSHLTHDRKAFALEAAHSPQRAALFLLLDGRSIDELAWKAVRPEPVTPFDREEKESGEAS